jgi:hypothetical protein
MFILLHIKETPANFDGILQTRLYIIQTRAAVIEIHADLPVPSPMKKPPLCPFGNRVWNRCIAVGSRQIKKAKTIKAPAPTQKNSNAKLAQHGRPDA